MVYVNPAADLVVAKFSSQAEADSVECFRKEFLLADSLTPLHGGGHGGPGRGSKAVLGRIQPGYDRRQTARFVVPLWLCWN